MSDYLISQALDYLETELLAPESNLQAPEEWEEWLTTILPQTASKGFGDHHRDFWEWVWEIACQIGEQSLGLRNSQQCLGTVSSVWEQSLGLGKNH